jgi:hypothetical protein
VSVRAELKNYGVLNAHLVDRGRQRDLHYQIHTIAAGEHYRVIFNTQSLQEAWTVQISALRMPHDFVRFELGLALKRGVPIIPVAFDGSPMPVKSELPPKLAGLILLKAALRLQIAMASAECRQRKQVGPDYR